jgi:hypothetical protein
MNANRALGLVAAILVTVGQAMLFAVDTSAPAPANAEPVKYDTALGARNIAESQSAYGKSRGESGG